MPRDPRITLLLDVYDQAFDHKAWHGTPLWGSLRGLTQQAALWRPGRGRHNIWEVVLHTAYWKYIVRRRLARDATLSFPRAGSNWPALPAVTDARVSARGWRSRWTNAQHIYGIASHDLYHAGQIQLLKVLSRQSSVIR